MYEEKKWTLLRIFITDKDFYKGNPLYSELVLKAKHLGLAGATVLRGLSGFGNSKVVHSAGILAISEALPLVVEICDERPKLEKALAEFKKMLDESKCGGLMTLEIARVVHFV